MGQRCCRNCKKSLPVTSFSPRYKFECKACRAKRDRQRHFNRKYGLTTEDWAALLKKQKGRCALCRKPRFNRYGSLCVDHCHDTRRVRGLLCAPCNLALGVLGDTPKKLQRVLNYVQGEPV